MGGGNVGRAYTTWRHLDDGPMRQLVFMALIALDGDAQPRYWGGREALAEGIGRDVPPEPADDDRSPAAEKARKERANAFEAVKSRTRYLVDKGALTVVTPARAGRPAVYGLNLDPVDTAVSGKGEPTPGGKGEHTPEGKGEPVVGEGLPRRRGRVSLPPRKEEEPRGTTEEPISPLGEKSPAPITAQIPDPLPAPLPYLEASALLGTLDDLGSSYLARIPDDVGGLALRVVRAAQLYEREHPGRPRRATRRRVHSA